MSRINAQRKSCIDVFNAFLVEDATYAGIFEFPVIESCCDIPNRLICFSKSIACRDYNQWVHFYEDDSQFERIWRTPRKYLDILKRYNGVILPDFSLYRDMPYVMQVWNIYRSRAIGNWLQHNGIKVIPNIRYGDRRTYKIACDGIENGSVIAIGTHGTIKNKNDRAVFVEGLETVISIIDPKVIIIYGSTPEEIFKKYEDRNIGIVRFSSNYDIAHKAVV